MKPTRPVIVLGAALLAVVVNLAIFLIAGAAGAELRFPGPDGAAISWIVVVLFSAVPLGVALAAVALLVPRWRWVLPTALVAAPVVGLVSIPLMPVPVGFDVGTTVALSLMHVVVGAVGFLAVLALRRQPVRAASRATMGSSASA